MITLQGTNISSENSILKMIFLFPRWDMLISWRVCHFPQTFIYFWAATRHWPDAGLSLGSFQFTIGYRFFVVFCPCDPNSIFNGGSTLKPYQSVHWLKKSIGMYTTCHPCMVYLAKRPQSRVPSCRGICPRGPVSKLNRTKYTYCNYKY